jgi:hypothetical protein
MHFYSLTTNNISFFFAGPKYVTDEPDTMHIEGINKIGSREKIGNTEYIPAEQSRDDAEQVISNKCILLLYIIVI